MSVSPAGPGTTAEAPTRSRHPAGIRREAWCVGALTAAIVAATVLVRYLQFGASAFYGPSDGTIFATVAAHPFGSGGILRLSVRTTGDAYRYGRIAFPLLGWSAAGGHQQLIRWTLPVIDVLAVGLAAGCVAELAARAGRPVQLGFALLAAPGIWVATMVVVAEPLELALVLLCYLAVADRRPWGVAIVASAALLTKETVVLSLAPLVLVDVASRDWCLARRWLVPVAVLGAWWAWVRLRIGAWPFLEHSLSRDRGIAPPLVGYLQVARQGLGAGHAAHWGQGLAVMVAALTLAAAVLVCGKHPRNLLAWGALANACLIPLFGYNAVRYPAEVLRLLGPVEGLLIAALVSGSRLALPEPG